MWRPIIPVRRPQSEPNWSPYEPRIARRVQPVCYTTLEAELRITHKIEDAAKREDATRQCVDHWQRVLSGAALDMLTVAKNPGMTFEARPQTTDQCQYKIRRQQKRVTL